MTKCVGNFVLQAYLFSKSQEADVLFNKTSMTLTMPITTKSQEDECNSLFPSNNIKAIVKGCMRM